MGKNQSKQHTSSIHFYPPVVTVVGHVDHGKTTLLDAIRKTDIVGKEHGGITQRIGASSIEVMHEGQKKRITFIDTPGHEAFSRMRGRGIQAADIVLLVVSSVDGVMPQTRESITLLKESKLPMIVVLSKADLPEKNPEKVKQQLLKEGIMLEGLGGEVPVIEVSAKTQKNVKELLDLILLAFAMHVSQQRLSEKAKEALQAIVIESKLDPKAGSKATIVIKNGMVSIRDDIVCEDAMARVRMIVDDNGKQKHSATLGEAVEILGFEKTPKIGGLVLKKSEAAVTQPATLQEQSEASSKKPLLYQSTKPDNTVSIILCTDTFGSLEAIIQALPKEATVVSQKAGEISEADILLAKSTGAIVLGFNTRIRDEVAKLADVEKVPMKKYTIIYELIDEMKDVLEGKELSLLEKIFGKAKVLASFPFEKTKVLGVVVLEGRVAKGDKVRLMRGEEVVGESTIISVRQGKNQISKVEKGQEAGVIISPFLDFTIGDMLICHG